MELKVITQTLHPFNIVLFFISYIITLGNIMKQSNIKNVLMFKKTNNLIALLNLYEIIFVCIKSSLYEPCTDGGLKYNLSHLFHPQKNKFPFSCQ